jgi:hypothetical protein
MGLETAQAEPESEDWVKRETSSADLGDERLNRRLELVLRQLAAQPEKSIPACSRGWSETQAAYRFFSNEKVTPDKVLSAHREATVQRMRPHPVVLCVEDTSELDFTSKPQTEGLGPLNYELTRGNPHPPDGGFDAGGAVPGDVGVLAVGSRCQRPRGQGPPAPALASLGGKREPALGGRV